MTDQGDPDGAEFAIRNGAWDYIINPFALKTIEQQLIRSLQYQSEKAHRNDHLPLLRDEIVGNSPAVKECLTLVSQAASGNANSLIYGETGTGKELFAAAIHHNSPRVHNNFVVVDCSALPETIVESVLFGHEKGAYTGADRTRGGLVAQADKGTLFLDEIGELPLSIQKAFLRVIQERRFRPVGGTKEIDSDFTLIAATNRDLAEMVRRGEFRDDLLHRLTTIQINLPPLRAHKEDLEALAQHWVAKLCNQYKMPIKDFMPDFFDALKAYDWPGNVRELNQALERAVVSAGSSPFLFPKDLPVEIRAKMARDSVPPVAPPFDAAMDREPEGPLFQTMEAVRTAAIDDTERTYLSELMAHTGGDIAAAVDISGLSRARFYALLKKYGISTSFRTKPS